MTTLHPVWLFTDVLLDCDLTLSVAGTMHARLWLEGNTNGTPFLVGSQTVTNGSPVNFAVWNNTSQIWLEALEPGDASITYAFTGKNTAEGISFADSISVTAFEIVRPSGDTVGDNNWAVWREDQMGLTFDCEILPSTLDAEIYWTLVGLPPEAKIRWDPWDEVNGRPHVGVGTNPQLKVTYENAQSKYTDFMPPDNSWFGQKTIRVQVGNVTVTRPIWFFFNPSAIRTTRGMFGKQEAAWFHYHKESRAVPALMDMGFEFSTSLGDGVAAAHSWDAIHGDRFYVASPAYTVVMKSVFDVNVAGDSYSEEHYPENEKRGIHNVARHCEHEFWHSACEGETRWPFGLGHADSDGDRLSNAREAELGTKANVKDTCGLSRFSTEYSIYASYADQELFCRVKQNTAPLGNVSKDWAYLGAQFPRNETDE